MPLVLLEGFDDLSCWSGGTLVSSGRYGKGLRLTAGTSCMYPILTAHEDQVITAGFAFRFSGSIGSGGTMFLMRRTGNTSPELGVGYQSDGSLSVLRGMYTTVGVTTAGLVSTPDRWYYIELQAKHATPGGFVTVRVDGALVGSYVGDTRNGAGQEPIDDVYFAGNYGGSAYVEFDDFYLQTGPSDSFLGSLVVETLLPNGNGNVNQWIGVDGDSTNNYLNVDEAGTPVLTDYVYSSTVGHIDQYAMSDLVHTTGNVVGVCHSAHMVNTDAVTPRNVKLVNRRAADTKSAALPLSTAWRSYDYALVSDPENVATQRITVTGTPDQNRPGSYSHGIKLNAGVAGTITKIRYQRRSDSSNDLQLRIYGEVGALLGGPYNEDVAGYSTTGTYEITLPTPIAIPAGVFFIAIGGGTTPMGSGSPAVTPTTNITYVDTTFALSSGDWPFTAINEKHFLEPTFVAAGQTAGPWTIANVNALQSGIELA